MHTTLTLLSVLLGLGILPDATVPTSTPPPPSETGSFFSSLEAKPYGYFKLDASYDSSSLASGDYAKWVAPDRDGEDDFSSTVNQTRLGLDVRGQHRQLYAAARVEIDFYGGREDPDPRIRHAYVELSWPEHGVDLLVGQTSDVISPLNPSTLNYTVAWWAGNIGFRRPQVRLTKHFESTGPAAFQLEAALTHNIYDTRSGTLRGEDAGFPAVQTRLSVALPKLTLGLSGHRASEDFELVSGKTERVDSWSVNLDLVVPIAPAVTLKSELWRGSSLAPYLGGIGQGVVAGDSAAADLAPPSGVGSRGGWIAADVAPTRGRLRYAFGISIEDVDEAELAPGSRGRNSSVFGNAVFAASKHIDVGLELSHWKTDYELQDDADAFRVQTSFFYRF